MRTRDPGCDRISKHGGAKQAALMRTAQRRHSPGPLANVTEADKQNGKRQAARSRLHQAAWPRMKYHAGLILLEGLAMITEP